MYFSLKAVQWFIICGTSPPIVNLHGGNVPPIVNHCTAFNDRYTMFFQFLSPRKARLKFHAWRHFVPVLTIFCSADSSAGNRATFNPERYKPSASCFHDIKALFKPKKILDFLKILDWYYPLITARVCFIWPRSPN